MLITPTANDWCDQKQNERKCRDFCRDHREQRYMQLRNHINFQAHKYAFASVLLPPKDHRFSVSAVEMQRIADARQSHIAFSFLNGKDSFDFPPPIPADVNDIIQFREIVADLGIAHEKAFASVSGDIIPLLDQVKIVAAYFYRPETSNCAAGNR